jgi:hypothetical protein
MIEADLLLQINFEDLIKDFTTIEGNKSAPIMGIDKDSILYCSKVFD